MLHKTRKITQKRMAERFMDEVGFPDPELDRGERITEYALRMADMYEDWIHDSNLYITEDRLWNARDTIIEPAKDHWCDCIELETHGEILVESGFSKIKRKWEKYNCGTISAFKDRYSYKTNMNRHRELRDSVRKLKFSVTDVSGGWCEAIKRRDFKNDEEYYAKLAARKNYEICTTKKGEEGIDVEENSLFIADESNNDMDGEYLRDMLIKHGKRYDQDYIIFLPLESKKGQLIDPSTGKIKEYPIKNKFTLNPRLIKDKADGNYTRIKNKKFAFLESRELPKSHGFENQGERCRFYSYFGSSPNDSKGDFMTWEETQKKYPGESWSIMYED